MARIRSVHPGLFTDEEWVLCSPLARLLFIGLWTDADDQGVFEWKPVQIKMKLLANDAVDAASLLAELEDHRFLARFEHLEKPYAAIRNFRKFQRPKKPNSVHPLPDRLRTYVGLTDDSPEPSSAQPSAVPNRFRTGGELSLQMEDGGKDGGGEESSLLLSGIEEAFSLFWTAYPRKAARAAAREAFATAIAIAPPATVIAAAAAAAEAAKGIDLKFMPHPARWLAERRWEDAPEILAGEPNAPAAFGQFMTQALGGAR